MRALYDPDVGKKIQNGEKIDPPASMDEKKALILDHDLALWDTIERCTIVGSSDSSIRDVTATDIPWLLEQCPIERIYCNGTASYDLFRKYSLPVLEKWCKKQKREAPIISKLPSSSPANAAWSLSRLLDEWKKINLPAEGSVPDSDT